MRTQSQAQCPSFLTWIVAAIFLAATACSGMQWGKAASVAGDVAECTLDRVIEQERKLGHEDTVARLEVTSSDIRMQAAVKAAAKADAGAGGHAP